MLSRRWRTRGTRWALRQPGPAEPPALPSVLREQRGAGGMRIFPLPNSWEPQSSLCARAALVADERPSSARPGGRRRCRCVTRALSGRRGSWAYTWEQTMGSVLRGAGQKAGLQTVKARLTPRALKGVCSTARV